MHGGLEYLPIRLFTIVTWILALVGYYYSIRAHPKSEWKERFWYSAIMMSYIIHVILFYVMVIIFSPTPGNEVFTVWSNSLRIHGGLAILIKEIVAIFRQKVFNK